MLQPPRPRRRSRALAIAAIGATVAFVAVSAHLRGSRQGQRSWQTYGVCVALYSPNVLWVLLSSVLSYLPHSISLDTSANSTKPPLTPSCIFACNAAMQQHSAPVEVDDKDSLSAFFAKAVASARETLQSTECHEVDTTGLSQAALQGLDALEVEDVQAASQGCSFDDGPFEVAGVLQLGAHSSTKPLTLAGLVSKDVACFIDGAEVESAGSNLGSMYLGVAVWNVSVMADFDMLIEECDITSIVVKQVYLDWDAMQVLDSRPANAEGKAALEAFAADVAGSADGDEVAESPSYEYESGDSARGGGSQQDEGKAKANGGVDSVGKDENDEDDDYDNGEDAEEDESEDEDEEEEDDVEDEEEEKKDDEDEDEAVQAAGAESSPSDRRVLGAFNLAMPSGLGLNSADGDPAAFNATEMLQQMQFDAFDPNPPSSGGGSTGVDLDTFNATAMLQQLQFDAFDATAPDADGSSTDVDVAAFNATEFLQGLQFDSYGSFAGGSSADSATFNATEILQQMQLGAQTFAEGANEAAIAAADLADQTAREALEMANAAVENAIATAVVEALNTFLASALPIPHGLGGCPAGVPPSPPPPEPEPSPKPSPKPSP